MLIETCYGFPVKLRVGPNKSCFRQEMNTFCGKEISRKIWGLMVKVVGGELPMWGNHHKPDQRTYFVNSTTNRAWLRPAFHRQCSHLVPGHRARVLFYAGHQCEHTFFPSTPRQNSGTVPVPEYKVSTLYSGTKLGTESLCEHIFRWCPGTLPTNHLFSYPQFLVPLEISIVSVCSVY